MVLMGGSMHGRSLLSSVNNTHPKIKGKISFRDTLVEALALLKIAPFAADKPIASSDHND
jgi:hypothetical protein